MLRVGESGEKLKKKKEKMLRTINNAKNKSKKKIN